jgi:UDP-N-acetylmuramoylalanine--D-glutamate ligase
MTATLIVGAGKSGVAAANFLAARGGRVALADANASPDLPMQLDDRVTRCFGCQDEALLDGVEEIVVSPGVPLDIPLIERAAARGIRVIGEIELAYRYLRGTVVAVTGSNGKSTTTALIGEILRVAGREPVVAGNIGTPLISMIDEEKPRTYVLELSSFQLESVDAFRANVALLLNVTPDHMDRYATFEDYAAAKYRIFRNQQAGDTAIVNANVAPPKTAARICTFAATPPWFDGTDMILGDSRIPRSALRLEGNANVENALAAWVAAHAAGVDVASVEKAFREFRGLPHRMVLVRERGGVRWVNDSKGTNVDATLKSLEGFPAATVLLILGGKDKAGEFERMRDLVREKTRAVITIGKAAERIAEALDGAAEIVPMHDMGRAVEWAAKNAKPGETVLLSPACASFDQYRNFEHRGDHFEELVRAL